MKELIVLADKEMISEAEKLAEHLNCQVYTEKKNGTLMLHVSSEGILLEDDTMSMKPDFTEMSRRLAPSNLQREMLVKAVRIKGVDPGAVKVLDATAGLGEDSMVLAAAGFNVELYEANPIISTLLKDALRRAENVSGLCDAVGRMKLVEGDSIDAMRKLSEVSKMYAPDVVLLDPMFPERQKSGMIKKKFQLLQQLESPCSDEEELLEAALGCGAGKVVIKRPKKGAFLAGKKPDYMLTGKAIRYDCFTIAKR